MEDGDLPQGNFAQDARDCADSLYLYLTRLFLPVDDHVLVADMSAENRQWLNAHLGKCDLRAVSKDALLAQIRARHGAALLDTAIFGLSRRFPHLSARTVITRAQIAVLATLAVACLAMLMLAPLPGARVLVALLSLSFVGAGVFRATLALLASLRRPPPPVVGCGGSLPTYTVLVPLYREAAVLPGLMRGLSALDYPGIR